MANASGSRVTHKQFRLQRKVNSMAIVASGFALLDLPRSYDYEAVMLRIDANLNVTTGCTSVRAEAPCQLVPRVEVIADGKNTLFSAPFWAACLGKYDRKLPASGARATTAPTAASAAAYAVEAIGVVDFMTADGVRTKDSNFRTSALSLFQLRLTFGAAIDPFVPGAGVVAFTGTNNVDVFTSELVELPGSDGSYATPIALKKVSYQQVAYAASNTAAELRLPAGNLIKSVLFRGEGNTTAGEPSALTFNNFILQSGVDVRMNLAAKNLRAKNNADYGQITAGYYIADFTSKGEGRITLSDLWDVSGQAEPKAILDVTGAANVNAQAVVTEYILARAG